MFWHYISIVNSALSPVLSRRQEKMSASERETNRSSAAGFEENTSPSLSGDSKDDGHDRIQHDEHSDPRRGSTVTRQASVAALLRNPLSGMSEQDILADADLFVESKGLQESRDAFRKGALLARVNQRADGFEYLSALSEEEKGFLRQEITNRWSQPFMLYFLVVLCAGSAIVQGMDQTSVNGAQVSTYSCFSELMMTVMR